MRKLLVVVLLLAVAAVVVVIVYSGREGPSEDRDPVVVTDEEPGGATPRRPLRLEARETPTKLSEHRWLSEFERALARPDKSHAYYFRSQVCEDMEAILESDYLRGHLLDAIRKYGLESDDEKSRDIVLPILRVLRHPDATALIQAAFPGAKNDGERLVMLEAMSRAYHDPATASLWSIELALGSDVEDTRRSAWDLFATNAGDAELVYRTALRVYEETTRTEQRRRMLEEISHMGIANDSAREFLRGKLHSPRIDEIGVVVTGISEWGTENDAALIEQLAREFPAQGDYLRDVAGQIRRTIREREGLEPAPPD